MVATDGHRLATVDRRLPNARIERPARYLRVNLKGPPGRRMVVEDKVMLLARLFT